MKQAHIMLGTSAWTAEGWVGCFYPRDSKPAEFLPHYAQHFNSAEVDNTF